MSNEIACSGRGFLVFDYDATQSDGSTKRSKGVIDLGVITKLSDTLSKSSLSNVNIVSMGQRYNYFIDNGNSRTISVDFERITPRYPMRGEDTLPTVNDDTGAFFWEETISHGKDKPTTTHVVAKDPAPVDPDVEFAVNCITTITDENGISREVPDLTMSRKWTNAYWARALEKAIDRWQLKYNGVVFYYYPQDAALYMPQGDAEKDSEGIDINANYMYNAIRYDGYISNITYSHKAGEVERLTGSISFSVGRRIRRVQYSAA